MEEPRTLYRVGEFARLAGVTVRALHHYDRVGLLQPRRTRTGYLAVDAYLTEPVSKAVPGTSARGCLRDVFADVFREHLVDQRLVADVSAARFLAERFKHARIHADRDQSSRFVTKPD